MFEKIPIITILRFLCSFAMALETFEVVFSMEVWLKFGCGVIWVEFLKFRWDDTTTS